MRDENLFIYDGGRLGCYTHVTANPNYDEWRGDARCFCGRPATRTFIFVYVSGVFAPEYAEHCCANHTPADLHWTGCFPEPTSPRLLPVVGGPPNLMDNARRYLRQDSYGNWRKKICES
jgi:hypothetical protein